MIDRQMQSTRLAVLLLALSLLSACATSVHKDFLHNLTESQKTNGASPRIVTSLAYNDKEKILLVGHESGNIEIWDATKAKTMREIKAHDYRVSLLSFSADGKAFFSNSMFEYNTTLWNVRTGELIYSMPHSKGPVCVSPDSRYYLVANSAELYFFDYENMVELPEMYQLSYEVIEFMASDPSANLVAVGAGGVIHLLKFSMIHGKPHLEKIAQTNPPKVRSNIRGLLFSNNGNTLYSVTNRGNVDEWTTQPLKIKRSFPIVLKTVSDVAFLPSKGLLALSGNESQVWPGTDFGYVKVIPLDGRPPLSFKMTMKYPGQIEFVLPLSSILSAESYSMEVYALPK
jgi:WD40 repeat protein